MATKVAHGLGNAMKRVRRSIGLEVSREPLPAVAWPGCYPLYYPCQVGGVMCPDCVNREIALIDDHNRTGDRGSPGEWAIDAPQANYEDEMYCDHCGKPIPAAYGE